MIFAAKLLLAATLNVSPDDPGLKTWEEFLEGQNPQGKMHPSGAYDWDVAEMNKNLREQHMGESPKGDFACIKYPNGYVVRQKEGQLAGVSDGTTLWVQHPFKTLPEYYYHQHNKASEIHLGQPKVVKYAYEYLSKVIPHKMETKYPVVIQNLGDYQLRGSKDPKDQQGESLMLGLFHGGLLVAVAQSEWGATLISVAQEYRGRKLGPLMRKYWGQYCPKFQSGGYTPEGKKQAYRVWSNRVRELQSHGVYSQKVKSGEMSLEKVKEILSYAQASTEKVGQPPTTPQGKKGTGKLLLYSDDTQFILYDSAFLEDPEEEAYIKAFGFMRDSPTTGLYFYALDYEPSYRGLANAIAFQMARDEGSPLYVGEGYATMMEPGDLPVERKGNHLSLTKDVMDVKGQVRRERVVRKPLDPQQEIEYALMEVANAKEWEG